MTERYIFNADAEELFYNKLNNLHDKYVYHLILSGAADKGTDIESIKMTKNPIVNRKYCEKIVGGLVNIKPQIISTLKEDGKVKLECIFTKIEDNKYLNHIYMIQNVMDWPQLGKFSCQIWYLGEIGFEDIKKNWD